MINLNLDRLQLQNYHSNEAYKMLRTNVQLAGTDKKVISLTSCSPNEGKTAVAMNLAVSLAETGKRVIFIDADLRKSVILGRYKVAKTIKGFTHYLSGQSKFDEVIHDVNIENLHIVFSGPVPPNPAELLGSKYCRALIKAMRESYDYVIIDTPPLGSVIDGAIIAQECDGVIMVVESHAISYKFSQTVKEQLERTETPLLGVVLNKVNLSDNKYYGKHYGKYYGQYYRGDESDE